MSGNSLEAAESLGGMQEAEDLRRQDDDDDNDDDNDGVGSGSCGGDGRWSFRTTAQKINTTHYS